MCLSTTYNKPLLLLLLLIYLSTDFKEVLKKLPSILNGASFIAIDGEFTGLHHEVRPSPYDTPEERYDKLRKVSPKGSSHPARALS